MEKFPEHSETTLENALRTTDKYVWYWTERDSWIIPGEMPQEWIDAVRKARNCQTTVSSLRSDGVILKNGEPFFPLGYYSFQEIRC